MKRQAFLFLALLSLTPGCGLDIDGLDGAADELGETDSSDAESSTSTTDAESSTSTTDAESSTSTTDAESSTSTTDAESSTSTTDAESSSSTTDATTTESTTVSDAPADCFELEAEYEALVGMTECITDADCKIIAGHCGVGLGGCYYAVNASVDEASLDVLAQIWSDGGCTQGVCDCAAPPATAICEANVCVGAG